MNLSIVTPLYETKEIFQEVFESVLDNTTCSFEYIIVYNHPPYPELAKYIDDMAKKFAEVKILDPGKNIGCHQGCNFGFQKAQGEYLMKLDADTKIRRNNKWAQMMMEIFGQEKNLALLGPEIITPFTDEPLRQGGEYETKKLGSYQVDFKKDGVLGFSAVMFPRKIWEEFGPMESRYSINGQPVSSVLYGGEEADWCGKCLGKGYKMGIAKDIEFLHLGRTEKSDPVFGVWKFFYGNKITDLDMITWAKKFDGNKEQFNKACQSFGYPQVQVDQAWEGILKVKKNG